MVKKNLSVIIKALIIGYVITGIILVILAVLLYKLHFGTTAVYIGIIIAYVTSNFVGGYLLANYFQHRRLLQGVAYAGLYFALLLVISVIAEGTMVGSIASAVKVAMLCICSAAFGSIV